MGGGGAEEKGEEGDGRGGSKLAGGEKDSRGKGVFIIRPATSVGLTFCNYEYL